MDFMKFQTQSQKIRSSENICKLDPGFGYILGLPPTQDASHHQDYYIFSGESL